MYGLQRGVPGGDELPEEGILPELWGQARLVQPAVEVGVHDAIDEAPPITVSNLEALLPHALDGVVEGLKDWIDAEGEMHEKVYDVVWSDAERRRPGADGKLPPGGDTVDVGNATWSNTIGDPELITVWRDPNFDDKQSAFFYARVLEIPTPRGLCSHELPA